MEDKKAQVAKMVKELEDEGNTRLWVLFHAKMEKVQLDIHEHLNRIEMRIINQKESKLRFWADIILICGVGLYVMNSVFTMFPNMSF